MLWNQYKKNITNKKFWEKQTLHMYGFIASSVTDMANNLCASFILVKNIEQIKLQNGIKQHCVWVI